MEYATPRPRAAAIPALLAGMQSGLVGALCMLAWLGVIAEWQQRNFWIPVNLMASVFYGRHAIHSGFASETVSGLAVYIAMYTTIGALVAVALRDRFSRLRTFVLSVAVAIAWYYLTFRLLWKTMMPLVALLHVERTTAFGHLIYGAVLGGYPSRLPRASQDRAEEAAEPPPPADAANGAS